jgi:hypothetical protein
LVHNGSISDWQKHVVETGHEENMRTMTDSELFVHLLEEKEAPDEGFQHIVDSVPGTSRIALGVLSHADKDNRRLFLFRNGGSPIHVLAVPHFRSILFASTEDIIERALLHTYGHKDHVADRLQDYGASLVEFPKYRLTEFGLDGSTPTPFEHYDIDTPTAGFKSSSSSSPTKTIGGTDSRKMLTMSPNKNGEIKKTDTEENLKKCSKETREIAIASSLTIHETMPVLNSLRTHRMMQDHEMEHFKKWLTKPF